MERNGEQVKELVSNQKFLF